MPTNYEWLLHMDGEERQAWFDAEHVDAQRDNNGTCPNSDETASNGVDSREKLEAPNQQISQSDAPKSEETAENDASKDDIRDFDDSREKLEADVLRYYTHTTSTLMWPEDANTKTRWVSVSMDMVLGWLDRQAEIDRKEFQTILKELKAERDVWKMKCETREVAYKQADAERKRYSEQIDELIFERDALADDLLTCNREREHLRQALGCAIDHAHEITRLVDIDGEVA